MNNEVTISGTRLIQNSYPIVVTINIIILMSVLTELEYTTSQGIEIILNLAAFQGALTLLMIFVPGLKRIANQLYLNYATQFRMGDYILTTRIYGLSSDYTYGMQIAHGLLCGIALFYGLSVKRRYIIATFLILLSVFMNGRTGVVAAGVSIFIALIVVTKRGILSVFSFSIIILIPITGVVILYLMQSILPNVYKFISILFSEISDWAFRNEKTGTVAYLTRDNLYYPSGLSLLIGEGHRVYGQDANNWGYLATDIGFVNDLFMGGLIYCIIRYMSGFYLLYQSIQVSSIRWLLLPMLVVWIMANMKGQVTVNSTMMTLYIYIICCLKYLKKK